MKTSVSLTVTLKPGTAADKSYKTHIIPPMTILEIILLRSQKFFLSMVSAAYFLANEDDLKAGTYKFNIGYFCGIPVYYTVLFEEHKLAKKSAHIMRTTLTKEES